MDAILSNMRIRKIFAAVFLTEKRNCTIIIPLFLMEYPERLKDTMMKLAIYGYGNLGRGVECAAAAAPGRGCRFSVCTALFYSLQILL